MTDEDASERAAFLLRLRAGGIRDLNVLRAIERVPRRAFVVDRYSDLAARELALPIGCGQTLDPPFLVARMVEALAVARDHRVLQIGAGSGYTTGILAHLAAEVMALERYQTLARAAQERLGDLGLANAAVVWADGLDGTVQLPPFDRILVNGLLPNVSDWLVERLAAGGIAVFGRREDGAQTVARAQKAEDGTLTVTDLGPGRFQALVPGLAAVL